MTLPLFIGGLGPPELLLIAGVLILLFGASKLPKLARSMGTATGEFKKGREEVEDELQELREGGDVSADSETDAGVDETPDVEAAPDIESEPEPEIETEADAADPERDPDGSGV